MRALILGIALSLAVAGTALAQGYTYQPSGLEYQPTVPVAVGESVQGLMRLETGILALGQVRVEGVYYGDMFAFWVGDYNGNPYYYDRYDGYWKPGPVGTQYATLNFQGEPVEGWVRYFGQYTDYDHFFGRDGVLYKRINVTRGRSRDTNRRRQTIYTYFINTDTGERSDGEGLPYRVIVGDEDTVVALIDEQMDAREAAVAQIVDGDPAYPQWETEAFEPPAEVVAPATVPSTGERTLLDLMENELEPLNVQIVEPVAAADGAAQGDDAAEGE